MMWLSPRALLASGIDFRLSLLVASFGVAMCLVGYAIGAKTQAAAVRECADVCAAECADQEGHTEPQGARHD